MGPSIALGGDCRETLPAHCWPLRIPRAALGQGEVTDGKKLTTGGYLKSYSNSRPCPSEQSASGELQTYPHRAALYMSKTAQLTIRNQTLQVLLPTSELVSKFYDLFGPMAPDRN